MAASGAGDVFRGVYEGSISGSHMELGKRPYHKNCTCALHDSRGARCPTHKTTKISYPIRRSWSEGSLALYAASTSSNPSPSSSPAVDAKITPRSHHHFQNHLHMNICNEDDDDDDDDDLFPNNTSCKF